MADTARNRRPESSGLDLDEALTIREQYAAGVRVRHLAAEYGVSLASVYAVLREQSHRCVLRAELPATLFVRLSQAAQAAGCTREQLAVDLVARALAPVPPP
jgi:hypothetical protein